jgi:chromosome partitioning protein
MRVLLVDCDLQKSSMGWRDLREVNDVVAMAITTPTVHKDLGRFEDAFDLAVIDCGGETHSPILPSAMNAAAKNGVVVIPVLPSVYDVWATEDTMNILRQVRGVQDVDARFLINQVMNGRLLSGEVSESLEDLKEEVPALDSKLVFRESFKKSIKDGKGVVEYTDPKAKAEMEKLFEELLSIVDQKTGGR